MNVLVTGANRDTVRRLAIEGVPIDWLRHAPLGLDWAGAAVGPAGSSRLVRT